MSADLEARGAERDRAEQALREADRRKDEFLATLGHGLRNPLSAITHAVRLWQESPQDREVMELARSVTERQTTNLCRHVDDLLDVARISEGKIELRERPLDLADAVHRAIETARPLFSEKQQRLEWVPGPRELWHLDADATRIEQLFANLLTNAARYTPAGGCVRVEARYESSEAVLTVRDNGVGIRPGMLSEIFNLFAQGEPSPHRTGVGLGIGLHLCRQIVELHGGCITAQSEGVGLGAAMSGYAQEEDRAEAFAAGFNHHFAKPVAALLVAADARG
jgi:signal transduction histidine kinase